MEENSIGQKLLAEAFGTCFLVFIGVGSVPATLLLLGKHQFTMAELGVISFAFAMVVIAMVYAIGHISGCHINPALTFGPMLVLQILGGTVHWSHIWAYFGGEFVGGALAGLTYMAIAKTKTREILPVFFLDAATTE